MDSTSTSYLYGYQLMYIDQSAAERIPDWKTARFPSQSSAKARWLQVLLQYQKGSSRLNLEMKSRTPFAYQNWNLTGRQR